MHKNAYSLMEFFKENYLSAEDSLEILNVGSIDSTNEFDYKNIFKESNWNYTCLSDKKSSKADIVVHDIYNWYEIEDDSFDVVFSMELALFSCFSVEVVFSVALVIF